MSDVQGETTGVADPGPDRKVQILEVLVFLFLIVPSMVVSFFMAQQGSASFPFVAAASILRDLALLSLVLYFAWRNGEALTRFGWDFRGRGRDVVLGLALFPLLFLGFNYLDRVLQGFGLSAPPASLPEFLAPAGPAQYVLGFVLVVVVAVAEETIFRGYLICRLHAATGSQAVAVLLSSFIFSLGHGYEGTSGVVTVGCLGLVFAWIYLRRGSLVAPMVLHFLQDAVSIVILPLLGGT